MARKRSSKETYAQKVVGLATVGLPAPVQTVAKSRWGSRILLLLIPVLVATGVVTISWSGGLPSITVNKDRAAVVGQEVRQEARSWSQTSPCCGLLPWPWPGTRRTSSCRGCFCA
jgi:hypothetical protein